jgi:hypothetical protein
VRIRLTARELQDLAALIDREAEVALRDGGDA